MSSGENVNDVLSSASKLASYNMVFQLSFRILTFILNAVTLRYISREALGVVNVRLTLLYSTILFLSREPFRRACLSKTPKGSKAAQWQQMINLIWCIVPVGGICSVALTYIWIHHLEVPDPDETPHYTTSAIVFGACAFFELLQEPLWILAQALLFVRLKILSESIAMILRCILTAVLVIFLPQLGILAFCITQVLFSVTCVAIFYGYFTWYIASGTSKKFEEFPFSSPRQFFPRLTNAVAAIDGSTAKLTWSFCKQSILKQVLTEGEKYVMTLLNVLSFGDQGIYDVVINLGSLAARFIFLPIEESFYLFFAKVLERGVDPEKQDQETMASVRKVLFCLLRIVTVLGLVIFTFGVPFSTLLLNIYGGAILSEGSGPLLLKTYCFYVLLIAVNGVTECFVFAAMSQAEVDRYNKKMLVFSLLFLLSSYYFTAYLGSVGFILANCLNMLVRILHSVSFIQRYFSGGKINGPGPLSGLMPRPEVVGSLGIAFVLCCGSGWMADYTGRLFIERHESEMGAFLMKLAHLLCGGIIFLVNVVIIHASETEAVSFIQEQYFSKRKTN